MNNIPEGYVLVPVKWAEKYFNKIGWTEITDPTISQVAEYVGVSIIKIKKDIKNINCPLKQTYKGGKGKGNQKKFLKSSVELYKIWI